MWGIGEGGQRAKGREGGVKRLERKPEGDLSTQFFDHVVTECLWKLVMKAFAQVNILVNVSFFSSVGFSS